MDHVFGSRWLIDELRQLGFSISYDEVGRYKQMVVDKGIPIHQYIGPPRQSLSNVVFKPILTLQFPHISPLPVYYSNVLWQFLNRSNDKMPNLSGFMQHVFRTQLTFDSVVDHLYKCTVSMPGTNGSHRYRFSLVTGFS